MPPPPPIKRVGSGCLIMRVRTRPTPNGPTPPTHLGPRLLQAPASSLDKSWVKPRSETGGPRTPPPIYQPVRFRPARSTATGRQLHPRRALGGRRCPACPPPPPRKRRRYLHACMARPAITFMAPRSAKRAVAAGGLSEDAAPASVPTITTTHAHAHRDRLSWPGLARPAVSLRSPFS